MFHINRKLFYVVFLLLLSLGILQQANAQDQLSSTNNVSTISWSSNGEILAIGGLIEGELNVQLYTSDNIFISQVEFEGGIFSTAWSPNNTQLAILVGGDTNQVEIIDVSTEKAIVSIPHPGGTSTFDMEWSPDGAYLATVKGGFVNVWDTSNGSAISTLQSDVIDVDDIQSFIWLSNNQIIFTISDNLLRTWDIQSNTITDGTQLSGFPVKMVVSPDKTMLAVGNSAGSFDVFDSQTFQLLNNFKTDIDVLWFLAWSPDSAQVAASGFSSDIEIWDITVGQKMDAISKQTPGFLKAIAYSPFGGRLFYATNAAGIGGPTAEPQAAAERSYSASMLNGAIQIVVPAPSIEKLQAITKQCDTQSSIEQSLDAQISSNSLQSFTDQVSQLDDSQIAPGCKADLLAVANALMAQSQ